MDPQIPYIQIEPENSEKLVKVSNFLINGGWNVQLIQNYFNIIDVSCILQIPLSRIARRD